MMCQLPSQTSAQCVIAAAVGPKRHAGHPRRDGHRAAGVDHQHREPVQEANLAFCGFVRTLVGLGALGGAIADIELPEDLFVQEEGRLARRLALLGDGHEAVVKILSPNRRGAR